MVVVLWIIESRDAAIRRERARFDNEARRWRLDDGDVKGAETERKSNGVGRLLRQLIGRRRDEKRLGSDFEV